MICWFVISLEGENITNWVVFTSNFSVLVNAGGSFKGFPLVLQDHTYQMCSASTCGLDPLFPSEKQRVALEGLQVRWHWVFFWSAALENECSSHIAYTGGCMEMRHSSSQLSTLSCHDIGLHGRGYEWECSSLSKSRQNICMNLDEVSFEKDGELSSHS